MKTAQPKLITHRSQLTSIQQFVDDCLHSIASSPKNVLDFSKEEDRERFREYLSKLFLSFTCTLDMELGKAAEKGIAEALSLMRDPDYYETVKRRRANSRQRQKDYQDKQELDTFMKKHFPTTKEVERQISYTENNLNYHERQILLERKRLEDLKIKLSSAIEMNPDDGDESNGLVM
jgi:hypothetical protein